MPHPWEPTWDEESGCWTVEFRIEGRRVRRRLSIRDRSLKAQARQKARAVYGAEVKRGLDEPLAPPGLPFWKAAQQYVAQGGEARFLTPIMRHFGPHRTIEEIGESEIAECEAALYPNATPGTRRRQVRVPISAVIRAARGERRQSRQDRSRCRWLTPEEFEGLVQAASPGLIPKLGFLVGSGCRPGEMFAAEVHDWNAATRQLWVAGERIGAGKTPLSARWVRLPSRSVDMLGPLPEVGAMFVTRHGLPYTLRANSGGQIAREFGKARDRAGLGSEVTPYVLRHTWATWFYAQTRDYGALLDQGGWAHADTAERYRKLAPDDLAERLYAHGWDFGRESGQPRGVAKIVSRG